MSSPTAKSRAYDLDAVTRWLDRVSDAFNAILVKETRQSLKSRQFVVTFMLLLVGSWLASFLNVLWSGDAIEFGSVGGWFFVVYYCMLAVAMFVIVPFGAFRSLLSERDENTWELLSITALSPRQIVWGKLLSALVQLFIYYSAIAPFVAFASLLKGFDLPKAAYMLGVSLLVSLGYCMSALMLATFARQKHWQTLMSVGLMGGLVLSTGSFVFGGGIAEFFFGVELPFDDPDFWWGNAFALTVGLTYFVLFQKIATANLTFESDNRSTGIRVAASVQFFLIWGCLLAWKVVQEIPLRDEFLLFLCGLSVLNWSVFGLFAASEPDRLSRRVRRGLPKNPLLRLLYAPFLPGGARGFVWTLGQLVATAGLLLALCAIDEYQQTAGATAVGSTLAAYSDYDFGEASRFLVGAACYSVFYLGLACLLGRTFPRVSGELKPAHVRVIVVLLALFVVIVPYLMSAFGARAFRRYSLLYVADPFQTLERIANSRQYGEEALALLFVAAAVMMLVNLPAMIRGLSGVLRTVKHDAPRGEEAAA